MDRREKLSDGIHYTLIPATMMIEDNDMAWDIRILEGPFVETVIRFGNIKMGEDDMMHFNFIVISSPDSELNEENEELQQYAGDILISVLEKAIENNALVIGKPDELNQD